MFDLSLFKIEIKLGNIEVDATGHGPKGILGILFNRPARPENPFAGRFTQYDQAEALHQNFLAWLEKKNFEVREHSVVYTLPRIEFYLDIKGDQNVQGTYHAVINWHEPGPNNCHNLWIQRKGDPILDTFSESTWPTSKSQKRWKNANIGQMAADWVEADAVAVSYNSHTNLAIGNLSTRSLQLP